MLRFLATGTSMVSSDLSDSQFSRGLNFSLDLPPMMFIKKSPNSHGWVNPRDIEDIWKDHFDYFYRELADDPDPSKICVFPITCHPDVSGRPHVLLMHER